MASAASQQNTPQIISSLLEVSKLDTLYRDVFFQRARALMGTLLSQSSYTSVKENVLPFPGVLSTGREPPS